MSLSVNLPVIIDNATRNKFIKASTVEKVNAVYAKVKDTDYYGIKGNAGDAIKPLWEDARRAALLASQISLEADQIQFKSNNVFVNGKLKADYIDAIELAAKKAFADALTVKRLKIDSDKKSNKDFEVRIDEDIGISVRNNNKVMFEVSKTGNAIFSGDIITPPFELRQGSIKSYTLNYTNRLIAEIIKNTTYISNDALPYIGYIKCVGMFNNKSIKGISNYISKGTKIYNDVIIWNNKKLHGTSEYCVGDITYSTQVFELNIYLANGSIENFQDSILIQKINHTEKRIIEYVLNQENYNSYNEFSPNAAAFKPSKKIANLNIIINEKSSTMKLKNLPSGDGHYELGTIFIENGFLKIKE